jgi:hypothetical protein
MDYPMLLGVYVAGLLMGAVAMRLYQRSVRPWEIPTPKSSNPKPALTPAQEALKAKKFP